MSPLTARQVEILAAAATGEQLKVTARRLYLSTATVKRHRKNITARLGAHNTTHAVHLAHTLGLFDVPKRAMVVGGVAA